MQKRPGTKYPQLTLTKKVVKKVLLAANAPSLDSDIAIKSVKRFVKFKRVTSKTGVNLLRKLFFLCRKKTEPLNFFSNKLKRSVLFRTFSHDIKTFLR